MSEKKIGIVTNCSCNYGSMLQAFASTTAIKREIGVRAEIIRFNSATSFGGRIAKKVRTAWERRYNVDYWKNRFLRLGYEKKRNADYFSPFERERIPESERTFASFDELKRYAADNYVACVCGSDQVWNPLVYKNGPLQFLRFVPENKRFAYSPSIGVSEIPARYRDEMARFVAEIPNLSCREQRGVEIIKELTGRDATHTVDPTFLLSRDEWKAVANFDAVPDSPYILAYFLQNDRYMRERVADLSKKLGVRVVVLPFSYVDSTSTRFERRFDVGPREFVALIAGAALVCTDSFHGTAFSINFGKPFLSFRRYKKCAEAAAGSRITGILAKLGLNEREVLVETEIDSNKLEIDYAPVDPLLSEWRAESTAYLRRLARF